MAKTKKDQHRAKILEYLADPSNTEIEREDIAKKVCGFTGTQGLYFHFTGAELDEIYREALEIRRTRYAKELMQVDRGLVKKAVSGDAQAAKLVFQRYEGWVEKKEQKNTGDLKVILEQVEVDDS